MSRRHGLRAVASPPIITLASRLSAGRSVIGAGSPGTGASPWSDAADFVLAFPFVLESPTPIYKGFWVNGSATGGNSDVAVYDEEYKFIVSTGSTAHGSNGVPQATAMSSTVWLPPGLYHAGMSHDSQTTQHVSRWSLATTGIAFWMAQGCWKFADAPPISGDATPADLTNVAFPVFGLITRTGFDL